jgi:hypothetical protein
MSSNPFVIRLLLFVAVAVLLSGFLGYRKAKSSAKPVKLWAMKGLAFFALARGIVSLTRFFDLGYFLVEALAVFVAVLVGMFYLSGALSISIRDKKEKTAKARAPF